MLYSKTTAFPEFEGDAEGAWHRASGAILDKTQQFVADINMISDAVFRHHAQRLREMLRGSWNRASGPERVHYFSSVADGMQASTPPTRLQQAEACREVPGRQVWLLLSVASLSAHLSTSHCWAAWYSIGLLIESTPKGLSFFSFLLLMWECLISVVPMPTNMLSMIPPCKLGPDPHAPSLGWHVCLFL